MKQLTIVTMLAIFILSGCGKDKPEMEFDFNQQVCRPLSIEETRQTAVTYVKEALRVLTEETNEGRFYGFTANQNFWFACAKAGILFDDSMAIKKKDVERLIRASNRARADRIIEWIEKGTVNFNGFFNITRHEYTECACIFNGYDTSGYAGSLSQLILERAIAGAVMREIDSTLTQRDEYRYPYDGMMELVKYIDTVNFTFDDLNISRQVIYSKLRLGLDIQLYSEVESFVSKCIERCIFNMDELNRYYSMYLSYGGTKTLEDFGLSDSMLDHLKKRPAINMAVEYMSAAYSACTPETSDCNRVGSLMTHAYDISDSVGISLSYLADSVGIPHLYFTWMQKAAGLPIDDMLSLRIVESVDYFPCQ